MTQAIWMLALNCMLVLCGCTTHRYTDQAIPTTSAQSTSTKSRASIQTKSILLTHSGIAKVGQQMPFFAGWSVGKTPRYPINNSKAFPKNKAGYIVTFCASWCKPCLEGLTRLSQNKARLKKANKQVVIIIADQLEAAEKLYQRFNLSWTSVVSDEYLKIATQLTPHSISKKAKKSAGLSLPKTFVLDQQQIIKYIIAQEGEDFIDLLN